MQQRVPKALALLATKLEEGLSGELIVAGTELEAHVFLQDGRVAWAYSSHTRGLFLQELRSSTQIDDDALREVLEDCRKQRQHVAETLINWGLASERDVRRALWMQIGTTLQGISQELDSDALFLKRPSENYKPTLTFSLDEFQRERFSTLPPSSEEDPELLLREASLQQQLNEQVPAALWMRLLRSGHRSRSAGALNFFNEILVELQATECAYRDEQGWLFATALSDGYSFCGLRPDTLLSKARKTLNPQESTPPPPPLDLGVLRQASLPPIFSLLRTTFEQVPQLAAMRFLTPGATHTLERKGTPTTFAADIEKACNLLRLQPSQFIQPTSGPVSKRPHIPPGIRLLLPTYHLLGAPLSEDRFIWLALCPTFLEGLSWGLLTNTIRIFHNEHA